MGSILRAICECGYSGRGRCSSGRRGHGRVFHYPHHCKRCKAVVSPDLLSHILLCPECGNKDLTLYGTVELLKAAPHRWWWQRFIWWAVGLGPSSKKKPEAAPQPPVNSSFCFVQNKTYSIPREQYKCPKCREQKLRFHLEALYD